MTRAELKRNAREKLGGPWAKSFCPFRAYGMWLMTHPLAVSVRSGSRTQHLPWSNCA